MPMFGFGKKKEVQQPLPPGLPLEQVMVLKQRGMENNQIISELERQGYSSSQIFDAINQAGISGSDSGFSQPADMNMPQPDFSQQQYAYPQPQLQQPPEEQQDSINKELIEEVAEAIIDEKWKEFEEDIKVIIDWKEKTEARINQFDQRITDLTGSLNSLHKSLLGKISEYDRNITDVGTEIKAMEKVFQKVLPSLTENVNKLERMSKGSKADRKDL